MAIRVVRLGSPRAKGEGLRIGTVRRPPRGVPRQQHASRDFYDVWLPNLAPSEELVRLALRAEGDAPWRTFARRYRAELKRPETQRLLELLVALSHRANLSVGCYCENESRCHRSILRAVLRERGAALAWGPTPSTLGLAASSSARLPLTPCAAPRRPTGSSSCAGR
jgi:uncharacterized protein YeaO (DUF488 family)